MTVKETKLCVVCKKSFSNRKSWKLRQQWEQVLYCSTRCQQGKNKLLIFLEVGERSN